MIDKFRDEVAKANPRPKGVKVSPALWLELNKAGLIKKKQVGIGGVLDLGFELPFYDEDIYLIYDPELESIGKDFILPGS